MMVILRFLIRGKLSFRVPLCASFVEKHFLASHNVEEKVVGYLVKGVGGLKGIIQIGTKGKVFKWNDFPYLGLLNSNSIDA